MSTDHTSPDPTIIPLLKAWHALEAASRRIREAAARQAGVSSSDFQVVVLLSVKGPTVAGGIADELGMSTGAVTALTDRLEDAGYAERASHPTDRRSIVVRLTPPGQQIALQAGMLFGSAAEAAISPSERDSTAATLTALADALVSEHRAP